MKEKKLTLSVLVPVYNEQYLVEESIKRLLILRESPYLSGVQVIIVDDFSNDGSTDILNKLYKEFRSSQKEDFFQWIFLRHEKNLGKGKAIKTALKKATGDISIIHDADLEYHPQDILKMIPLFIEEHADAVYGSRFLVGDYHRALRFHHELGNKFLTFLSNLVTDINLTDMETCYKAIRTRLFKSIPIESNDFTLEPEITIKLAKRGARIFEVPISYSGRDYQEGKKINWKDGVKALRGIIKYWLSDNIYTENEYGSHILSRLARAEKYNNWIADIIRPFVGEYVMEIGCGTGNFSKKLFPRKKYYVTDLNPLYLDYLRNLQLSRPYLKVCYCDINDKETLPELDKDEIIDTIICLNLLEHIDDERTALENIKSTLHTGGRAIILVPNNPSIFGSLDEVVGHRRRYTEEKLKNLLEDMDFEIEKIFGINRLGTLGWWINGKILRCKSFSNFQISLLNMITPLLKILDKILPLPYLSIIAVVKNKQ